jgi:transcriptional regulator with XRE-family HTH domain
MRTTLRKAREASGVSMKELARRLGVTVPSVSSLELNDESGSAKPQTVDRALEALGLARWDVVMPAEVLNGIVRDARASVGRVRWTMALEAQNISDSAVDELVSRSVARRVAALQ